MPLCDYWERSNWRVIEHMKAQHVPSVFNNFAAGGNSGWAFNDVQANSVALRPDIAWQVKDLGEAGRTLCTSVLGSGSSEIPLRIRPGAFRFVGGVPLRRVKHDFACFRRWRFEQCVVVFV